ncbi:GIY-YIG nuclease family protein [Zunongwangia sp. H14]|uniref:GIY-YIG nuclease family protein n=1 Tax=Zunongwangia sp. H14 TaxID=3240792 RepID=UPI0035621B32
MYFVYAIRSQLKDWIYVGMTNNVQRRIAQHNAGQNKSTKAYKPFQFLFSENFPTRPEARKREKYLKSTAGKRWIRNNF